MSGEASEAAVEATPPRRSAVAFIFVTILLDMLALGVVIPMLPKLIESFVDNDTANAARIFGLFGTGWALMQFIFSPVLGGLSDRFGRRPVVLLSNFGLAADYVLMALAPSLCLAVRRPADLGHHLGEHLDGVRLYRRHHAAGEARGRIRQDRRCLRRGLHPGPRARRPVRRHVAAAAVLDRGGPELCQRALWPVHPAGIAAAGRAVRRSAGRAPIRSACCLFLRSNRILAGLQLSNFFAQLAHVVLPSTFVLYATYRYGWDVQDGRADARDCRRLLDGGAGCGDRADREAARRTEGAAVRSRVAARSASSSTARRRPGCCSGSAFP